MTRHVSVSVFLAAFNEESNIADAVLSVRKALKERVYDWEILIVNDGSTDKTQAICETLQQQDKRIRILNHQHNLGLGHAMKTALVASRKEYFTIFPGDNDMSWQSLARVLKYAGYADLVTGYIASDSHRSYIRQIMSRLYVVIMNILFRMKLKYFNGPFLCKTSNLRSLSLESDGMDIIAELKVKMIHRKSSFMEIIVEHTGRKHGSSKAYTIKNVYQVLTNTLRLFCSEYFFRRNP